MLWFDRVCHALRDMIKTNLMMASTRGFYWWFIAVLICVFSFTHRLVAETNYFRSDGGVARAAALPDNLERAETLSWRVPLDGGHSSPILNSGKIFVTTWRAKAQELATVALNEKTGKELWRNTIKPEKIEELHQIGSPATATVACDGKRIYS